MGAVDYRGGIAVLQLITFPVFLVTALFIWKRTGWRAGGKCWRFVVTLSLIRIIGSICTLLAINNPNNENIYIAEAVCELIGIAPLLLAYIGLLGQIDVDHKINPRVLNIAAIIGIIGLILGIAGVSSADRGDGPYRPGSTVQAAMGIFLAVFVITVLLTIYLGMLLRSTVSAWQKKLFLAICLSWPFLIIRLVYSAVGDYTTDKRFTVLSGDPTTYLCMSVLEEIIAIGFCVVFGTMAVLEKERTKIAYSEMTPSPYVNEV